MMTELLKWALCGLNYQAQSSHKVDLIQVELGIPLSRLYKVYIYALLYVARCRELTREKFQLT